MHKYSTKVNTKKLCIAKIINIFNNMFPKYSFKLFSMKKSKYHKRTHSPLSLLARLNAI